MRFGPVHWRDIGGRPAFRWAVVTATSPGVVLTMDGDDGPLEVPPTVLAHVGPLTTSDRVWCRIESGGAVVVVGKAA